MQKLIELEKRGWQVLSTSMRAAKEFYRPLLSENAVMVFPGGMRLSGKKRILESMASQPWNNFHLDDTQVIMPSDVTALVVYRVSARRAQSEPYQALISSLYVQRSGEWRLAFHQQTPI